MLAFRLLQWGKGWESGQGWLYRVFPGTQGAFHLFNRPGRVNRPDHHHYHPPRPKMKAMESCQVFDLDRLDGFDIAIFRAAVWMAGKDKLVKH